MILAPALQALFVEEILAMEGEITNRRHTVGWHSQQQEVGRKGGRRKGDLGSAVKVDMVDADNAVLHMWWRQCA